MNDEGLIQVNFEHVNSIDIIYVINQQITKSSFKVSRPISDMKHFSQLWPQLLRQNVRQCMQTRDTEGSFWITLLVSSFINVEFEMAPLN